nr:class I adenylate-forming enzyme family protein [Nitratireductor arenosus]
MGIPHRAGLGRRPRPPYLRRNERDHEIHNRPSALGSKPVDLAALRREEFGVEETRTVGSLFERACRLNSERAFLLENGLRLSGHEAARACAAAAATLSAYAVKPDDTVAFMCGPSVAHTVSFFAAQRLGAVCCCLHVKESDQRAVRTLRVVGPRLVVCDADQAERVRALLAAADASAAVLVADDLLSTADEHTQADAVARNGDDPAVILLSSGTTGAPKQVLHTQRTVLATAAMATPIYGAEGPEDGVVIPMAPSFAAWLHTVLPFLAIGAKLYFEKAFDAERYVETMDREGLTVAAMVPTLWRAALPAFNARTPRSLKVAMFSGEPGTPDLVAALKRLAPRLRSVYLSSEGGCACGIVADESLLGQPGMAGAAGRVVEGGALRVVDPVSHDMEPLPAGATGEVAIRGPSLSPGYVGEKNRTARAFLTGWWRSGDLGFLDDTGLLHLKGRLDNRINSGGIKVHAEEVEAALLHLAEVRAVAVVGVPDEKWGERIEAHIVPAAPGATAAQLSDAIAHANLLPKAMRPKTIHIRDALPTGPTGKLYRKALRETSGARTTDLPSAGTDKKGVA